jgi:hypothetical protein
MLRQSLKTPVMHNVLPEELGIARLQRDGDVRDGAEL